MTSTVSGGLGSRGLATFGLFVPCLLVLVLSGCFRGPITWQRVSLNEPIAPEQVAFIQEGKTSLSEVATRLGAPDEIVKSKERIVARYHFSDGRYFRVDFGWGFRFLVPVFSPDMVLGGGGFGTDVFEVACDSRMVVQQYAFAFHVNSSKFRFWPYGD